MFKAIYRLFRINKQFDYSWWLIGFIVLSCAFSLNYTIANLGFNTDTTEMLSPDLPFHQNRIHFWKTFPQDVKSILVVIDAPSPEASRNVAKRLGNLLKLENKFFKTVYIPGEGKFFDEQALLFLNEDEITRFGDKLAMLQPLLGKLAQNNSLEGVFEILAKVLTDPQSSSSLDIKPLLSTIANAFSDAEKGKKQSVSWQKLFAGDDSKFISNRRFILVKANLDFSQILPAQKIFNKIKGYASSIEAHNPGVTIRMTGETALEHEELESVSKGSSISALLSLVLVCGTLLVGLRSVPLMFATFITLIAGLLLTAGFATLTVGHLNMISIAFAVLYIGLGVDYAIHLCLHYQFFRNQQLSHEVAITSAIKAVGPALGLCALTSAVGFYSFIPTSYIGVSELGIISGTSMFIGLVVTFALLPSLLKVMKVSGVKQNSVEHQEQTANSLFLFISSRYRFIRWSVLGLAILAAYIAPRLNFDFDPVHLRDEDSESVKTYNDLVKDVDISPLTLTVLEPNRQQMLATVSKIRLLGTVDKVVTLEDFIPQDQPNKLKLIEDMSLVLGPLPQSFPGVNDNYHQVAAFNRFIKTLDAAISKQKGTDLESELVALKNQFERFQLKSDKPSAELEILKIFEQNLLTGLPATISRLQNYLKAEPFDKQNLPADLHDRWLSRDGVYRIQVFPKEDITKLENLRAFVEGVQQLVPYATDLPVIYLEAGKEVVKAFQQALTTALLAIIVVLLWVLRSIRETVFVLIPLLLASLLTGATCVLIGLPLNFANIIAVPLLFGLGVDNGIHIMHSLRNGTFEFSGFSQNITSRGIVLSGLTTIFSFSSLAFSAHAGTASLGILLAIGIFFMLFCTLVVLPAFAVPFYLKQTREEISVPI